jgi:hypothetical protein
MEEKNKIGNIEATETNGIPSVKSESSPFAETLYFTKFYEEKAYKKFIRNIERLIRSSKEYKSYIELLRTNLKALNFDNILSYITTTDAEIEFHHYPYSLYDLVDVVCIHKFLQKEKFTSFAVAKEVMKLHFENIVGLVPLSVTNHELAHNGDLFISSKQIFGEYSKIAERYPKSVSPELLEKIKEMEDLSAKNTPSDIRGLF